MHAVITDQSERIGSGWGMSDFFLGVAPLLVGAQLLAWIFFLPAALHAHSSFRQLYTAGYMVRTGHAHELYDYDAQKSFQDRLLSREPMMMPFIRPPFDALIFAPLTWFPYPSAYLLLLGLNIGAIGATLSLLRPWTRNLRAQSQWLPLAIFVSFVPVASALMMGQDSIVLLALLSLSMIALEKDKQFTAGTIAGLGLFKFHLVIPLALLLLYWRRLRFFAGFSLVAVALAGLSVWMVGAAQLRLYAESLLSISQGKTSGTQELLRYRLPVNVMANVHGLATGLLGGHLSSSWLTGLTIVVGAAILLWVATAVPRSVPAHRMVALALTSSVFVSHYLFMYDLTILLLPLLLALNRCFRTGQGPPDPLLSWSCVLLFLAPACLFAFLSYFYVVSLFALFFLIALVRSTRQDYCGPVAIRC